MFLRSALNHRGASEIYCLQDSEASEPIKGRGKLSQTKESDSTVSLSQ